MQDVERKAQTLTPVEIFDTTLRDGEQSPGCGMNASEKLRMARALEELGVDVLEAGFPQASDDDFAAVSAIARELRHTRIAALARCARGDIERAAAALEKAARPRLHVFIASSDIHLTHKLRITREQCLQRAGEMVRLAKSLCDDVEFSAEDASRTDLEFLSMLVDVAHAAGASTINLPDTVGYAMPDEIATMFATIGRVAPEAVLSCHCHNDLGMAVANSLAAVRAGARQVECTVNGIGERAGNAALEEIVMALNVRRSLLPYAVGVRSERIAAASRSLCELTGVEVQPHKAIVGRNAFAHEAGIHQDGVLKNPLTYEIMTPQSVGVSDNRMVLGKHSGRSALASRCAQLGCELDRRSLDRLYRGFTALADRVKSVDDAMLRRLIDELAAEETNVA